MGTRGYRTVRYRHRYYALYNHWDSYPKGLGAAIVASLPKERQDYVNDLKKIEAWEEQLMRYLCRFRADYIVEDPNEAVKAVMEAKEETNDGAEKIVDCDCAAWFTGTSYPDGNKTSSWRHRDSHEASPMPSFWPPLNDLWIEWVYTIDHDNHAFTVNNSAHLCLDRIPRDDWIGALADGPYSDNIFLVDLLPAGTVVGIATPFPQPDQSLLQLHDQLDMRIVHAQGIAGFPPAQRHGPIFRAQIYEILLKSLATALSATLLSWKPRDFPFRETAFVLLSLASGGHTALVPQHNLLEEDRDGFSDLLVPDFRNGGSRAKPEFLAHLWTGCHLQGNAPGSAPPKTTFWFDGALVHLASHLDQQDAVRAGIAVVRQRCLSERPGKSSNALLLSIEHVILLRVYPDSNRVDRTKVLTLLDIPLHRSLDPEERYERMNRSSELQDYMHGVKVRRGYESPSTRVASPEPLAEQLPEETSPGDAQSEPSDDGALFAVDFGEHPLTNFYCLAHFLEVSAREELRLERSIGEVFPTEIYELVLQHIDDLETSRACMRVSRVFRDLCLRKCVMADGVVFIPNPWTQNYECQVEGGEEEEEGNEEEAEQEGKQSEEGEEEEESFTLEGETRTPEGHEGFQAYLSRDGSTSGPVAGGRRLVRLVPGYGARRGFMEKTLRWNVAIGNQKHRRTLLPSAAFSLV